MNPAAPPDPDASPQTATPVTTQGAILDDDAILRATETWLEKAVIGLNLCPFAKAVHRKRQIRYVVCADETTADLATTLATELVALQAADPATVETTLLIHPRVLTDFYDYNAFLGVADRLLKRLGLRGTLQIASFHPHYQFAGSAPDAIENHTNRAPYPMLHLLREASIEHAIDSVDDADLIVERNIATLQALGPAGWHALGVGPAEPDAVNDTPAPRR